MLRNPPYPEFDAAIKKHGKRKGRPSNLTDH
jgi:hypothetical protein